MIYIYVWVCKCVLSATVRFTRYRNNDLIVWVNRDFFAKRLFHVLYLTAPPPDGVQFAIIDYDTDTDQLFTEPFD